MTKPIVTIDQEFKELVQLVVQKDGGIQAFKELLNMRREVEKEIARKEFYDALAALQKELPKIEKNKAVLNRDGSIRYKYCSLDKIIETITPHLSTHGFSYQFKVNLEGDLVSVTCILYHKSGHKEETTIKLPARNSEHMSLIQQVGAAITYGKRYTLAAILGIAEEEDTDGVLPAEKEPEPKPKQELPKPNPKAQPKGGFDKYAFLRQMRDVKKQLGEEEYYRILGEHGFEKSNQINDKPTAVKVYKAMVKRLEEIKADAPTSNPEASTPTDSSSDEGEVVV